MMHVKCISEFCCYPAGIKHGTAIHCFSYDISRVSLSLISIYLPFFRYPFCANVNVKRSTC